MPTRKSVHLEHRGGMQFVASPSSGHAIAFDERASNQGGSPVETVLAALAACTAMDVISIAAKKRQAVERYEVEASGTQRDEYPQVYTEIDLVPCGPRDGSCRRRRSAARSSCPRRSTARSARWSRPGRPSITRYRIHPAVITPFEAAGIVISTGPYRGPTSWPSDGGGSDSRQVERIGSASNASRRTRPRVQTRVRGPGPTSAGSRAGTRGSSR